jgi:uncharacterized surface protein with fasciclin (FAS1) repeats
MDEKMIKTIHNPGKYIIMSMLTIFLSTAFISCDPPIEDESLYTFTDKLIGQYLTDTAHTEEFSEFANLLDTTKVLGLLNSYGYYTCFAPTNEAMRNYYQSKGKSGLKDFTLDSLKIIAYDHLIQGTVVKYVNFINGELSEMTMSGRYPLISFKDDGTAIVNETSYILKKDITVHNGVIHKIDKVLDPIRKGVVELISTDTKFSVFYEALISTGMADSLLKIADDTYDAAQYKSLILTPKEKNDWFYQEVPAYRNYGFTILMESDETFKAANINNLMDLKTYAAQIYDEVYPEDAHVTDITDRHNSLNRFIAYHLIDKRLSNVKFIDLYDTDHMLKTRDMYEYIETMCPNTLLEVKKERLTGRTNLFNPLNESATVSLTSDIDNSALNGVYHEIDKILTFNINTQTYLSSKRLRFDAASFFPELTNNNLRGSRFKQNTTSTMYGEQSLHYQIPKGYISRIKASEQTVVGYLAGFPKFQNYMGDEIFLSASSGKLYDFVITTPPIPSGTYEVRFGYLTNGKRGVAQLYMDGVPAGVPLNLNNLATNSSIGYQAPGVNSEDLSGFENDKMMRNRGYMKAPACFKVVVSGWTGGENARYSNANLRKIMGTYEFQTAGHHQLMVKGLSAGEFMFDYLEFIPTSALESEDVY